MIRTMISTPTNRSTTPAISSYPSWWICMVATVLFKMEVNLLDNELALLILLAHFVRLEICPANQSLTSLTKEVANSVQSSNERPFFRLAQRYVHALSKQKGSPMSTMKTLGDNVVVASQMRAAMCTCVDGCTIQVDHGVVRTLRFVSLGNETHIIPQ